MLPVHTFNDLADANLAATWGRRYGLRERDATFRHSNPYRLMEVSDHFGKHAKLTNPPAENEHRTLTLGKLYWPQAKEAPALVRESPPNNLPPGAGRFYFHAEEWFADAGDYLQYKPFLAKADPNFVLKAPGQPDVKCKLTLGFLTLASQQVREFEILIPPAEFAKMATGADYTLHPLNANPDLKWKVKEGLTLRREPSAEEKIDELLKRIEALEKRLERLEKKER